MSATFFANLKNSSLLEAVSKPICLAGCSIAASLSIGSSAAKELPQPKPDSFEYRPALKAFHLKATELLGQMNDPKFAVREAGTINFQRLLDETSCLINPMPAPLLAEFGMSAPGTDLLRNPIKVLEPEQRFRIGEINQHYNNSRPRNCRVFVDDVSVSNVISELNSIQRIDLEDGVRLPNAKIRLEAEQSHSFSALLSEVCRITQTVPQYSKDNSSIRLIPAQIIFPELESKVEYLSFDFGMFSIIPKKDGKYAISYLHDPLTELIKIADLEKGISPDMNFENTASVSDRFESKFPRSERFNYSSPIFYTLERGNLACTLWLSQKPAELTINLARNNTFSLGNHFHQITIDPGLEKSYLKISTYIFNGINLEDTTSMMNHVASLAVANYSYKFLNSEGEEIKTTSSNCNFNFESRFCQKIFTLNTIPAKIKVYGHSEISSHQFVLRVGPEVKISSYKPMTLDLSKMPPRRRFGQLQLPPAPANWMFPAGW